MCPFKCGAATQCLLPYYAIRQTNRHQTPPSYPVLRPPAPSGNLSSTSSLLTQGDHCYNLTPIDLTTKLPCFPLDVPGPALWMLGNLLSPDFYPVPVRQCSHVWPHASLKSNRLCRCQPHQPWRRRHLRGRGRPLS